MSGPSSLSKFLVFLEEGLLREERLKSSKEGLSFW